MIRAVIFDFNGILADDDPIHMQAFREVAGESGLTFSDAEYMETYLPLNDRDCFHALWKRNGRSLSPEETERLIRRKSEWYFKAIANKDVLYAGTVDAVRAAASRGPVAIASGASITEIRHILGGAGILDCFTTIVAMEDVRRGKPDPEPFKLAFDRLKEHNRDLVLQDCAAVEDSLGGIESAHSAGLSCLGVAHSYPRKRLEAAKPRWVIDSISEFAGWLKNV